MSSEKKAKNFKTVEIKKKKKSALQASTTCVLIDHFAAKFGNEIL